MGSKLAAKEAVKKYNIPWFGLDHEDNIYTEAKKVASEIDSIL
jgi:hypothetical protein